MRIVRSGQAATSTGRGRDLGAPGETFTIKHLNGTAIGTVSLAGKPVYFNTSCDRTALPAGNSWLKCTKTTMDADSFHTWYVDRDVSGNAVTWPNFLGRGQTYLKKLTLLRGSFTGTPPSNNFTAGGASYVFDSRFMRIDGTRPTPPNNADGIGFFPIDGTGLNSGTACNDNQQHNFHFTSEVRFWFQYDSSKEPRLDFSGDDDVWVYVNGHLALDLGGIHGRLASSFTINATNATAWGLENGKVYEIAVFQAERNICLSNYWLTLNGFNAAKDVCSSICGDGILASDELCDDGEANHPTNPPPYGICGPDCKTRGPFCGDGARQQPQEECDDGLNLSTYDFDGTGCAPGCIRPAHCGDGQIDAPYEECDKGAGNDGSYGGCTSTCRLAARCGDGIVQREFGEQCDDGPRGSASCSPSCLSTVPR
jgi:fibro-slime domain-containing protein